MKATSGFMKSASTFLPRSLTSCLSPSSLCLQRHTTLYDCAWRLLIHSFPLLYHSKWFPHENCYINQDGSLRTCATSAKLVHSLDLLHRGSRFTPISCYISQAGSFLYPATSFHRTHSCIGLHLDTWFRNFYDF